MEATAKLLTARARVAEVQGKFESDKLKIGADSAIKVQTNRREEESHVLDSALKVKQLREPLNQGGAGRPRETDQRRKTS